MINPPLEPLQLDLFPETLTTGPIGRGLGIDPETRRADAQRAYSEALRKQVAGTLSSQVWPPSPPQLSDTIMSANIPAVETSEEKARRLLQGAKEEGDTGIEDLLEDLIALGVEDLRILQSNSVWNVECRIAVTHRPAKQSVSPGPAFGSFKAWNEPAMRSYMRLEVSAAMSLREAVREVLLAAQLYVSTKAVHGGGR